jgi:hypothetical protein
LEGGRIVRLSIKPGLKPSVARKKPWRRAEDEREDCVDAILYLRRRWWVDGGEGMKLQ